MSRVWSVSLLLAATACSAGPVTQRPVAPSPPGVAPAMSGPRESVFGHSVQGRPLRVWQLGDPAAARRVLVIGVVHGDEPAGQAIALSLLKDAAPRGASLLVIPDANPDGVAAGTRQNADGVDLNRNFPQQWQPLGRRGDQQYSGPGPLSEPESRALTLLIRKARPTVSVWFHQPVGAVDASGGSLLDEQRFADLLGEPVRRLPRYPGSAVGWENHALTGSTAFVVELPRKPPAALLRRAVAAVLAELRG